MPTLTITRGLPASGKTSYAKNWLHWGDRHAPRARVNRDDLRAMLFSKPNYGTEQEQLVTRIQRAALQHGLESGYDMIADDTNIKPSYAKDWWKFAQKHGAHFHAVEFDVDIEECIARDAVREKKVGEAVIRRMARSLNKGRLRPFVAPAVEPAVPMVPYVANPELPRAVMVDIDGTVALHDGRSPYDMSRVSEDLPNEPVIQLVRALAMEGYLIVFCSGRTDDARLDTERWINKHVVRGWEALHMRKAGDSRKDSIVKYELFDDKIRDQYNVRFVLDDRDQVVEMWREIGLTCLQVAPGDF